MSKFKVGDRVDWKDQPAWQNIQITKKDDVFDWRVERADGEYSYVMSDNIEHATKFAVGDRVRVVNNSSDRIDYSGKEGIIIGQFHDELLVEIGNDGCSLLFKPDEIESAAVAASLTIRAGRYYKTRDGRKVGPMESGLWGGFYDAMRAYTGYNWNDDGSYIAGDVCNLDLIAEWVDEPAVAVAEPKFKVGDQVENAIPGNDYDSLGTVTDVRARGIRVRWDKQQDTGDDGLNWYEHQLRLVAPATGGKRETFTVKDAKFFVGDSNGGWHQISGKRPAIVALIENGQPKPSTEPFVHPDRSAALREAKRLAGKHKGQEFGVYELVSVAKVEKTYDHEWQRLATEGSRVLAICNLRDAAGLHYDGAKAAVDSWLMRAA